MTANNNKRIEKIYPLSPMQTGMFFHALKNEQSLAYFEQMTFWVKGEMDPDLLQRSFDIIFQRYDILRTVFRIDKLDRPLQFVLKQRNFKLHVEDISRLSEGERDAYLEKYIQTDRQKGFDLTRDILMRVSLFETGPAGYALVWSFHHILTDGWCMGIIFKELMQVYHLLKQGKPVRLEPAKPYENYIKWLERQDKDRGLEYWENYLRGYEQTAALPKLKHSYTDKSSDDNDFQAYRLEETNLVIPGEEIQALTAIAGKNRATLNTVFQTLWGILLGKYTNSHDVVYGAVVSGRPPEIDGIEKMVGLFINTVPVRIKTGDHDGFEQLLTTIQRENIASKLYEYLPLAEIQAQNPLKANLIEHIMAFENIPLQQEIKNGQMDEFSFDVQEVEQFNQTNFDFNLIIIPQKPFIVRFNYNLLVYDKEFMENVGRHLKEIIRQVSVNPGITVKEIEIITEEEKQRVLIEFNRSDADYPRDKTIQELFAEQVEKRPDHIAVLISHEGHEGHEGVVEITYKALNEKANRTAHHLRERGVTAGDIVAIKIERSIDMMIGIFGILKAGGAYLPIDPGYPQERIDYMLNDSGARLLLTIEGVAFLHQPVPRMIPLPGGVPEGRGGSLAYVIYTSGTTGKPKGAMITHRNLVRLMFNDRFQFDFNHSDIWTMFHSFCFDFSVWEMYGALLYGGKLIIIPKMAARDTARYLEILRQEGVTVLNQTPSAFYNLMNLELKEPAAYLNLRYIIFGGEALSPGKLNAWRARYPAVKLINMYGITETTVHVTFKEIGDHEIEAGISNIGVPIPTLKVYILDKHLAVQPIGIAGELCVTGDGVGLGYLNRPELTAEKFIITKKGTGKKNGKKNQIIYKSGDLGRWLFSGELEYLGRIDQQVKIRGFRIELGEIENRLAGVAGIEDAIVIATDDEKGDKYLCAYFVAKNEIPTARLREYLSGYLPDYMVPSYFVPLATIPLTANGKLDRKALPEPGFKAGADYVAPRSQTEEKLAQIWSEVLSIKKEIIGIDHNFFELGGHSLKATGLIAKIHKTLNAKIPLGEVFIKPSIRELASFIEAGEKETHVSIEKIEDREYYQASSAQKRLYLLQIMDPQSTAYNSYVTLRLAGKLEKPHLEKTFIKMIQRHESLRTSFHMLADEPVQRVHRQVDFEIQYLTGDDNKDQKENIRRFIRPFDLAHTPLLRVGLLQTSGDEYIMVADMHHIITDGASMGLLVDDFMALYQGKKLPGLHIQYRDYSRWHNNLHESEAIKRQESYWLNRFADEIPVLNLPIDFPRPAMLSFEGSKMDIVIGSHETRQLNALALEEGASLFMVLLTIFNIFLAKITGQESIVVGTPNAGRRHADLEKIIGMFINTLVLKNQPAGEKTVRQFLREVAQTTLEAFENQDYQFEDLVDRLVKERDTSRNPLFDAMFVLQNMDIAAMEIPGLKLKPYTVKRITALFDLTFQGIETADNIIFSIEYRTTLFKKDTAERLARYFNQVIESVLADREQRIQDVDIMTGKERRRILLDFNNTDAYYPADRTIVQLFEEAAKKNPDVTAIVCPAYSGENDALGERRFITYRELNRRAGRLALGLKQKGVKPGSIVGIMMERSLELAIGLFGILKSGAAYLPILPDQPRERVEYMLNDSKAIFLLTAHELPGLLDAAIRDETLSASTPARPSDLAYIIYTSGSTGRPKGVVVEHKGVCAMTYFRKKQYRLTADDNTLQLFSVSFDGFVASFYTPLASGSRVTLLHDEDTRDINRIKEVVIFERIRQLHGVASLYASLLEICSPGDLDSLRVIILGGEELKPAILEKSKRITPHTQITNEYGPTEITVICTLIDNVQPAAAIPIGKPLANTKIYILDRHKHPVPIGIAGELIVGGIGVTRGYLNNPELTAQKFLFASHEPYRSYMSYKTCKPYSPKKIYQTGDLAKWLPDGNIQFLGRIDQQVKIRGFRIEPGEIESRMLKHEHISEALVLARKDSDGNTYLCAYYVTTASARESGSELTVSGLKGFLSSQLAPYMIPSYFVQLEKMPAASSGKVDRKALPEPDISNIKLDSVYAAPGDDLEKRIAQTWQEVLNLDRVGTRDNFFDLGGNSLKIARLSNRLTHALGIKIPVLKLFQYPTIASLKEYLSKREPQLNDQAAGQRKPQMQAIDIAIIGMSGRFPGANNIRRFQENLEKGIESISFFSAGELAEAGVPPALLQEPGYVKARGIPEHKDCFDAAFFDYTPQEARIMDPQMRMMHECAWETLEDAGYNPDICDKAIGLYAGSAYNTSWQARVRFLASDDMMDAFESHPFTDSHFIPTRISYKLNLKGPAIFIQTACSTSLTAIHTACGALLAGDCDMALAGGVSLTAEKKIGYLYREGLVLSPDGRCRAFDAAAAGTVGGEGAALVLLKPLHRAIADRDHIYAVIKASAANNDGARKVGFSAPSIDGQAEAIAAVYRKAGIPTESIAYVEAHGTGTVLGDPIEIEALKQAFRTPKKGFCAIGSVKSNVGHMDSAAGAAGLIKAVLALKHKKIPPTLHFEAPNLQADLVNSPFYVNTELSPWEPGPYPRRAGLSAFGIGGTNVHVVLEEWPGKEAREPKKTYRLILLSARTLTALERRAQDLADYLNQNPTIDLGDVAYTLQQGRKAFEYRWMALCSSVEETGEALKSWKSGETYHCPGGENGTPPMNVEATDDKRALLGIGRLWLRGQPIDWNGLYPGETPARVSLPTYPFEGQPYWIDGNLFDIENLVQRHRESQGTSTASSGRWQGSTLPPPPANRWQPLRFLVFASRSPIVQQLIQRLRSTGPEKQRHTVITVTPGKKYRRTGDVEFTIEPDNSSDYRALFAELKQNHRYPDRILHTWNIMEDMEAGLNSLRYLSEAIEKQDAANAMRIDVITAGAREVTGEEPLTPQASRLQETIDAISRQNTAASYRAIDIELPQEGSMQEQALATGLMHECFAGLDRREAGIAYRGRTRFTLSEKY